MRFQGGNLQMITLGLFPARDGSCGGTRTHNPLVNGQTLRQLSFAGTNGAVDETRTHNVGVGNAGLYL